MKKGLIVVVLVIAAAFVAGRTAPAQTEPRLTGSLSLSGAWALYPMALKWTEEFQKLQPGVKIDVQAGGAGKGIADALAGMVDIGMVSRNIHPAEVEKGAFAVAVTKDAVVPMISLRNPLLKALQGRGVKREEFIALWIDKTLKAWDELFGGPARSAIHLYTRSDACGAAETWAAYLGKRQEDLAGIGVYGDPGLAEAVRRDPLGIGYNNVNFAYDARTLQPVEGLAVLPLDLDGNGRVDPAENVYARRDDLTRAIAEGRYPSPPARDLYFVTKGRPEKPVLVAFLNWVLTQGQAFVQETGYIRLAPERLQEEMKKISR
jgi:phosphate transport system substrate-binding protein